MIFKGLLLTEQECVLVDHQVRESIRLGWIARGRTPPYYLVVLAEQIHECAELCRENEQATAGAGRGGSCAGADRSISSQETVMLTTAEAAGYASISETLVRRLCRQERVRATRDGQGGAWQIDATTLEAWMSTRKERD